MKPALFFVAVSVLPCSVALGQVSEPGRVVNPNPVDISPEWRKLAEQYKKQIDALRAKRGDTKTEEDKLKNNLDKIDVQDVFDKSNNEIEESGRDAAIEAGKAGYEYFKDFGKLTSIVESSNTIMGDILPDVKAQVDAFAKPGEAWREHDRLERNIGDLDDNMRKFDKDIDTAQRNMDLSNKAADFYQTNKFAYLEKRQEIVFRLVNKSKQINQTAAVTIPQYENTIPAGWVACSCPDVHRQYGRVVRGVLYHPNNIYCPK